VEIGIGLPNAVAGTDGRALVDVARRAEDAGFSTLGTIDRIAYPNYESLIALAAAAAATERIGLLTSVLLAPLRSTPLLAKQAVSVDNISGGRLTLGVAVGGRQDDYAETGVPFKKRGSIFDGQLDELARLFGGEERGDGYPVVPRTVRDGGPQLVIGGMADKAFERAARYGAGWMMGGGGPDQFEQSAPKVDQAFEAAGRNEPPRKMALHYFALGDNAEADAARGLGHYYAFLGDIANYIVQGAAKSADEVKAVVDAFRGHGCDELVLFPASGDPAQVELLSEALDGVR
jgi:alkanesulfonate monooxygenase SsuD/methylene tetrahydromethanopterin reductase-like flavin-dependent oxidoreductase (luciferase family)